MKTVQILTIESTDASFMCHLIDWLNTANVKPNSTEITVSEKKHTKLPRKEDSNDFSME